MPITPRAQFRRDYRQARIVRRGGEMLGNMFGPAFIPAMRSVYPVSGWQQPAPHPGRGACFTNGIQAAIANGMVPSARLAMWQHIRANRAEG